MKTVAVIGCGKFVEGKEGWAIGHCHAQGYLSCGEEVQLCGVDLSEQNLAAFGERFSIPAERLFHSTDALYAAGVPDCVSICTWPALHYPMVVEALERGVKGIACEKPFTLDTLQIRDIEQRVRKAGAVVVIAHQRRLEAPFKTLKEVALSGKLGVKLHARGHVGDDWDILSWTTHWFDMANFLFDTSPEWVLAGMDLGSSRRYQHAVEDASIIYAQYGSERSGTFLTGPGSGASFTVEGELGIARIHEQNVEIATFEGCEKIAFDPNAPGGFVCLLGELMRALDGGPEPLCSIARTAAATEMAYAAHESARTGKKVSLPLQMLHAPLEVVQHPPKSSLAGKRTLLYADAHFGSGGREGIAETLRLLTGVEPIVLDAEVQGLGTADLSEVDALLLYHTQKEVHAETAAALREWVGAGKPLLIVHAGLGAWSDWQEYTEWCGFVWEWGTSIHPHEPAVLKVLPNDPLNLGWSEAWLPKDEVFAQLRQVSEVEIGLEAVIPDGSFPAAWRNIKRRNVGAWMPGHRHDSWFVPAMREGLERTLRSLMPRK